MTDARSVFAEGVLDRRRWAPVVDDVLERIAAAMARDRYPHALLLAGPEGFGRELVAVETAAMLVCAGEPRPWLDSRDADRVRSGVHPDAVVLCGEGRKKIVSIDAVRGVVDEAPGRPFEGRCRVWIVDSVDARCFPPQSANAFLKVLEEPPPHVRFILLAANPQSALPTIRSRCAQIVLPGAVAVARRLGAADGSPEVAHRGDGTGSAVAELLTRARDGLRQVLDGDDEAAFQLAYELGEVDHGLELAAAAACELAAERAEHDHGAAWSGLAAELLRADARARSLGLRPTRQMLSTLLRWAHEESRP
jgi:hypothetical protein